MKNTLRYTVLRSFAALALMALTALGALANNNPPGGGTTPLPKPDLTIVEVQPVYYQFGQYQWRAKDQLWAKIANIGQGHSGPFEMMFQWNHGYANEQWFWFYTVGLGPGQSDWVLLDTHGYNLYLRGSHAQLVIDFTHGVTESNENNNVYNYPK
jgi:hypothetical protein